MAINFDPDKDAINRRKHGVSLSKARDIDFIDALVERSDRPHDSEPRYRALVEVEGRVWSFAFADRAGRIRAISLRPANSKERQRYGDRAKHGR